MHNFCCYFFIFSSEIIFFFLNNKIIFLFYFIPCSDDTWRTTGFTNRDDSKGEVSCDKFCPTGFTKKGLGNGVTDDIEKLKDSKEPIK